MKKIIIAGGSGFIGKRLTELLLKEGYKVAWLSRKKSENAPVEIIPWAPAQQGIQAAALEGAWAVINLAGAGIADKRWTAARKELIIKSRVDSTNTLQKAIGACRNPPKIYVGASAIGYYGNRAEELLQESSSAGTGFLSESTQQWEAAHQSLVGASPIRSVLFRIGIVLEQGGGALQEIARPLHFGIGAYFSDGQAWYSWIHRDDMCRMFIWALENKEIQGMYNAVAPNPARNKALVTATKKALSTIAIPAPAPAFVLRLILGEMADVVLSSTKVSSVKIERAGFVFEYPTLQSALDAIYNSN